MICCIELCDWYIVITANIDHITKIVWGCRIRCVVEGTGILKIGKGKMGDSYTM